MADPSWTNPERWKVTPKKPKPPLQPIRKCACGCGAWAGRDTSGKPRRFLPHHQVSKMSLENQKNENAMAHEMAEAEARRIIEEFHADLDRLFAEAREVGLTGDALIAYVYADDMEERALRRVIERAVLDGNKEAITWVHNRKHGTASSKAKAPQPVAPTAKFLDPLEVRDSPDDFD